MFIRLVDRKYILIQFDSMQKKPRTEKCKELIKWFESSNDCKKYSLKVSAFFSTDISKQDDGFSCGLNILVIPDQYDVRMS